MRTKKRIITGIAAASAAALALTACSGDTAAETLENGDQKDITIAVFNGWDEGIAASELWKAILTEQGYDVELEYADPAPVYSGLSTGDYDLTLDTWLPVTHSDYVAEYGDDIVDLGAWNDEASLTIAVNEDSPITSLEELAGSADQFGNTIIGIEPGAGLTRVTQEDVIPGYGLEGMNYQTSSTAAMLTELQTATNNGENIVVTLWRPHWAYDAFPVRDLEDPKGLLGDAEGIHSYGKADIVETHPTAAAWIQNFKMDSEQLYSLENLMFNENETDDYAPIVEQWISENQEYVDSLTA
ncbi:glycine/betaine ABC transporter substrate-binding protein [Pseudoclavibacter sp. RFBJ3]|uniref:glycine betaine ABC transporter substrate-binding protein n=1 Tax=unclassified Pseudoclavibacter TaxID=2615177 RepID=UPI000CE7DF26|nr:MULTISPECIES: glycine betaine ABC transporter substrate-binding protein [unclassified Pseudoclavibacter]MBF4550247.1 glycine betaine ABC transporter substrate-binding protein [Pseudoclavibacter sp. VKM Ac-2888]PPF32789.1 glycine/betaine ABC transporter substrate-binding protein [Pseudoclavibacter sp. AY1H1]PPF74715.1 glycine/betaine ABC transporter substrate-binding protein [Pseudoclavibacter sp. Z016]PPF82912.1 glycine/betaine ABC transporter substrate-binding protein [Pseudoclavibacter sp.